MTDASTALRAASENLMSSLFDSREKAGGLAAIGEPRKFNLLCFETLPWLAQTVRKIRNY